ncbi:cytochrome b/b6 domain-containing protein [Thalassospira sp. TSL5-1]|uniref:cytochrome b/b6 domain-containing protein n=1 Tax=Thalassospira sp. TSL5-1 TaxID=1544451 RepID=UPI00093B7D24|nr:cytochrome b/b6 domain-containing protein [Thalassospira sp. TSL5-1]OKH89600.1 cytochrome B561 [Thalassospira sp. TSL5-1]
MNETIRVWDPLVRIFHWSLATCFAVAWISAENWDSLHEKTGYVALALVVFRLLWGLIGPRYARFTQFVRPPRDVLAYLRAIVTGHEKRYVGHNPAGGAMILLLLGLMAATGATGWLYSTPSYHDWHWIKEVHEFLANSLMVCVGLHVGGVLLASLRHHENLARSMINGRKRPPEPGDIG